jgi:hypothetical protein
MELMPLGDYEAFRWWSGKPKPWGPEGAGWRVWFGGKVIDGLCEVLDEHLAVQRLEGVRWPAAIGCMPWLGSDDIADRLLQMWCCIVVDKNELKLVPDRLIESQRGMPNTVLHMGRYRPENIDSDEDDYVKAGWEHEYAYELRPVRVYGWTKQPNVTKPLLHTKLLVLGELQLRMNYPDGADEFEDLHFVPQQVWCGSANWSNTSRLHHEMGLLCSDKALLYQATDYLRTLIKQSEPTTSGCAGPEPSLVYVEEPEPDFEEMAEWDARSEESHAEAEQLDDDEN